MQRVSGARHRVRQGSALGINRAYGVAPQVLGLVRDSRNYAWRTLRGFVERGLADLRRVGAEALSGHLSCLGEGDARGAVITIRCVFNVVTRQCRISTTPRFPPPNRRDERTPPLFENQVARRTVDEPRCIPSPQRVKW